MVIASRAIVAPVLLASEQIDACTDVEPLLETFFGVAWDQKLHHQLLRALARFGGPALEPVLAALPRARDLHERAALCEVLSKLGVRDDRLFDVFRELFADDRNYGALTFATYGDPRALPLLQRELDRPDLDRRDVLELAAAVRKLGGSFSPATLSRVQHAFAAMDSPSRKSAARRG